MFTASEWSKYAQALIAFSVWIAWLMSFDSANAAADEQAQEQIQTPSFEWVLGDSQSDLSTGSDCGVYCLNVIASIYNRPFDIRGYLETNGGKSAHGLSMSDLSDSLKQMGLEPVNFKNLHVMTLVQSEYPMILNFAAQSDGTSSHWVVFLGCENGEFKIFDTARPTKFALMSIGELQERWNGYAIAVMERGDLFFTWRSLASSLFPFMPYLIIATIGGLLCRMIKRPFLSLSLTLSVLLVWQALFDRSSIWASYSAAKFSIGRFDVTSVDTLSTESMISAIVSQSHLIIDTRTPRSFQRIRLRNSRNLPVDADLSWFREITRNWEKDRPIVVICQSVECGWAQYIAVLLKEFGHFTDVVVYPGGIQGLLDAGVDSSYFEVGELKSFDDTR